MFKVYDRNDLDDRAFLVKTGPVHVQFADSEPTTIECENIIVGTEGYFNAEDSKAPRKRQLDVFVNDPSCFDEVLFGSVDQMIKKYEFGYSTNIFLAHLTNLTNQHYIELTQTITTEMRRYQAHAQLFARLVNDVGLLAQSTKSTHLAKIFEKQKSLDLYEDGEILNKSDRLSSVNIPAKPMSEYVQRFKQGALICKEGAIANSMFVLLQGKVSVSSKGNYIASIEGQGEAFGELALFLEGKRTATLIAEKDTDVYEIKRTQLREFHYGHRNFFQAMAQRSCERISSNLDRIDRFSALKSVINSNSEINTSAEVLAASQKSIQTLFRELRELDEVGKDPLLKNLLKKHSII